MGNEIKMIEMYRYLKHLWLNEDKEKLRKKRKEKLDKINEHKGNS